MAEEFYRTDDLRIGMVQMVVDAFRYTGEELALLSRHTASIVSAVFSDVPNVASLADIRERLWREWNNGTIFYAAVAFELSNFVSDDELGAELRGHYGVWPIEGETQPLSE